MRKFQYTALGSSARGIALVAAVAGLTGCVADAMDSTSSFAPGAAGGNGQVYSFTADDFDSPKPAADVGASSATSGSVVADGSESADPVDENDIEALLALNAEPDGEEDSASAETPVAASAAADNTEQPQDGTVDIATARINAASRPSDGRISAPQPEKPRSGGLLALFSDNGSAKARQSSASLSDARRAPIVATTRSDKAPRPVVATASASGSTAALPGVDRERALGIKAGDEESGESSLFASRPVQLASAAGLARLAPNGLRTQTDNVDVSCLKPALVRVLKQVERAYGKPVIITSGYRNPPRNKRAGGAKNSLHMYCSAADIQIEGVSKWDLAESLRAMPGRGGVGTYCHTKSVHVDIGPERDWNWRCRG